ncbi:MAG: radical SAM/SPASM domain-containing protein [Candidatus Buchananbacteria bacterium]
MKKKPNKYPKFFEIQTGSYCNGLCKICPYAEVAPQLAQGVMTDELFKNIIGQISREGGRGIRIIPYFNNEPFLDPQFIRRLKYINETCPNCEVEVSTNLSLLGSVKQKELIGCSIDDLRLSVFGFTKKTYEQIMPGLNWKITKRNLDLLCENKKLRMGIGQISLIMIDYPGLTRRDVDLAKKYCRDNSLKFELWGFMDRGGNVNKYSNHIFREKISGCEQNRTLERLHILFDGRVVLCCMDWRQQYVLGDLSKQTIKQVWNSKKFQTVRKAIHGGGKAVPEICKKCKLAL